MADFRLKILSVLLRKRNYFLSLKATLTLHKYPEKAYIFEHYLSSVEHIFCLSGRVYKSSFSSVYHELRIASLINNMVPKPIHNHKTKKVFKPPWTIFNRSVSITIHKILIMIDGSFNGFVPVVVVGVDINERQVPTIRKLSFLHNTIIRSSIVKNSKAKTSRLFITLANMWYKKHWAFMSNSERHKYFIFFSKTKN